MLKMGRKRKNDEAAAAVEFALALPILMLVLFGIITTAYILSFRQDLSQAAAAGARAAAAVPPGETMPAKLNKARKAVERSLNPYGLTCGDNIECNITSFSCGQFDCVKVELVYDYQENPLLPIAPFTESILPAELVYTAIAEVND